MKTPTVLLFDIDGTLITTGGVGRLSIERAVARALGRPEETFGFAFAGMVDPVIVRRGLEQLNAEATEARVQALLGSYVAVLEDEVMAAPAQTYRAHPGVVDVLEAVSGREAIAVGLGTGNIERGARIKLERVGLNPYFSFGGFGSDAPVRSELLQAGVDRGRRVLGCVDAPCRVVVIGDTPRDVEAAEIIGAESLAVATGGATREALAAARPTLLVDTLEDAEVMPFLLEG